MALVYFERAVRLIETWYARYWMFFRTSLSRLWYPCVIVMDRST
jgi:hypothetical protein